MADPDVLWIGSVRDPDGAPVCGMSWHGEDWYPAVGDVRAAALDLLACAAYAEMMLHLTVALELDGPTASALITDLLKRQGRRQWFGNSATVKMLPAASTSARKAVVLLRRGTCEGHVETPKAREMAVHWLEIAEATESDRLLSEAMHGAGIGEDATETVFGYLKELRGWSERHGITP